MGGQGLFWFLLYVLFCVLILIFEDNLWFRSHRENNMGDDRGGMPDGHTSRRYQMLDDGVF